MSERKISPDPDSFAEVFPTWKHKAGFMAAVAVSSVSLVCAVNTGVNAIMYGDFDPFNDVDRSVVLPNQVRGGLDG